MAAFIFRDPNDRNAFDLHWKKIRNNNEILIRSILFEDQVAGNIESFMMDGKREIG